MKKDRAAGKSTASSTSDASNDEEAKGGQEDNTREQSDKNINKFNRLVVYDKEEERKSKYQSEVRGRVQDKNVRVDIEPQFILTFYEQPDPVKKLVYYDKTVENYNTRMVLKRKLIVTNQEAALTEDQVAEHFASINEYSARLSANPNDVDAYFGRALDYMLVQDFDEAIKDFDRVVELNPDFVMAYFNRAVVRYKQLEYNLSQEQPSYNEDFNTSNATINLRTGQTQGVTSNRLSTNDPASARLKDTKRAYEYEMVTRDYDIVIQKAPDFVFAYFNRGNLRCAQRDFRAAIEDYTTAIERDPEFADAYFNRGLARLSLGDARNGIADLSKAGELGIIDAYSIIKRMTSR